MAQKCAACGSLQTATQFDTWCCYDCGALTNVDGTFNREPKTVAQKGGPFGEPADAGAGQHADWRAGATADFPVEVWEAAVEKTTKKTTKKKVA